MKEDFPLSAVNTETETELEPVTWKFWKKRRYITILLAFFGICNVYALRVNLSVAIVAMTENHKIFDANGTIIGFEQYFKWSTTERGLILSSFFYGYVLTQLPGGYIGAKFGAKHVFGVSVLATAILTLITPICAYGGFYVIITIRFFEGVFGGVSFPCMYELLSKWSPPLERTLMTSIVNCGTFIGTTIALPLCGVLAEIWGWQSIFYVLGTISCIWYIAWTLIVAQVPEKDKLISHNELQYIQKSLAAENSNGKKLKYPWKSIFTSKPVYAIVIAGFCESWGFYILLTQLPTFLKDTLYFDLNDAGFLSAVPYLTQGCLTILMGFLVDFIRTKQWLTTTQARKYFNCSAFVAQACFLIIASYLVQPMMSIFFITLAVGMGAFSTCGYWVNPLDLAPQYAGVLMGIVNISATIAGIISPTVTGFIVETNTTAEWRIVFYIASGLYLIGSLIVWLWLSGEIQPWAKNTDKDTCNDCTEQPLYKLKIKD